MSVGGQHEVLEARVRVTCGRPTAVAAAEEGREEDAVDLDAVFLSDVDVVDLVDEFVVEPHPDDAVRLSGGVQLHVLNNILPFTRPEPPLSPP